MACLICKYFEPIEPEEHRQMRESGRCEKHCGDCWDAHTAVTYIKEHGKNVDGFCRWSPEPKRFSSGHVCAQIDVPDYFFNPHWALERMQPNDRLIEWSRKQYSNLFQQQGRVNDLEEQNQKLRRQLEASRKISASRLARLKQQQEESKQEPPLQYPRLVAAE
jgi:hypothetical protein